MKNFTRQGRLFLVDGVPALSLRREVGRFATAPLTPSQVDAIAQWLELQLQELDFDKLYIDHMNERSIIKSKLRWIQFCNMWAAIANHMVV